MIAKAKADASGATTAIHQRIRRDIESKILSGIGHPVIACHSSTN
jgi:hypothetical protein